MGVGGGRVVAEDGCMRSEYHGVLTYKMQGRMGRDIYNFNIRVSVSFCIEMIYTWEFISCNKDILIFEKIKHLLKSVLQTRSGPV